MADKNDNNEYNNRLATYLGLGLCFGTAFGIIFKNLAMCIGLGLCFGVALGSSFDKKDK